MSIQILSFIPRNSEEDDFQLLQVDGLSLSSSLNSDHEMLESSEEEEDYDDEDNDEDLDEFGNSVNKSNFVNDSLVV